MNGRCDARPELAARAIELDLHIPALPCSGGPALAERLFGPLGWSVDARPVPLDPEIPEWGDSRYVDLRLHGTLRLADALNHLYVLLPVLDDAKHYWVGSDEVDKLVRAGEGWLGAHPEKDLISHRYLAHRRNLSDAALERLTEADGETLTDELQVEAGDDAATGEARVALAVERRDTVLRVVRELRGRRVADLGCGEGALVGELLKVGEIDQVLACDVSARALYRLERRLHMREMSDRQRERLRVFQSSVTYADARLAGVDVAVLMEVVEHVDPPRLPALAQAVFGAARPGAVVVTTPNSEYNVRFETLAAGVFRHPDHRFEWTRAEFRAWADGVADRFGYGVRYRPVGPDDPEVGPPTQLAVFRQTEGAA
jgi:3' terminal RNA ribose 2'-O-methyltransferase Hen1